MADSKNVKGADNVIRNMDDAVARIGKGYKKGLTRAALYLQRASQKLTPVDTGNLRASAYTRVDGAGLDAKARVGYTAMYALFVHEAIEMKLKGKPRAKGHGRFWDPQGQAQAKFLETPMRTERPALMEFIRKGIQEDGKFKAT